MIAIIIWYNNNNNDDDDDDNDENNKFIDISKNNYFCAQFLSGWEEL